VQSPRFSSNPSLVGDCAAAPEGRIRLAWSDCPRCNGRNPRGHRVFRANRFAPDVDMQAAARVLRANSNPTSRFPSGARKADRYPYPHRRRSLQVHPACVTDIGEALKRWAFPERTHRAAYAGDVRTGPESDTAELRDAFLNAIGTAAGRCQRVPWLAQEAAADAYAILSVERRLGVEHSSGVRQSSCRGWRARM